MLETHEYIGNMHMHTPYSDGEGSHVEIAEAAIQAGLDFVIVTDHNVWVDGVQGYYGDQAKGYVLLLTGEEVHDRERLPMVNHCLVYNTNQEVSMYAKDPQTLIRQVHQLGGLTFLAHPFDKPIAWQVSQGIAWVDWEVQYYTGLEIWNYMSDFKDLLVTPWKTVRSVFQPEKYVVGPRDETLAKWDELLIAGKRVVGIGNSDAHGTRFQIGPLRHVVFPYDYLFHCVNTHILAGTHLVGDKDYDAEVIYRTLKAGRVFISYGILGNARGFRFSAQGGQGLSAQMGESIRLGHGVTLQVLTPAPANIRLIYKGEVVYEEKNGEALVYLAREAGAYRVEVWRDYKGMKRCWILSNPIYIEPNLTS